MPLSSVPPWPMTRPWCELITHPVQSLVTVSKTPFEFASTWMIPQPPPLLSCHLRTSLFWSSLSGHSPTQALTQDYHLQGRLVFFTSSLKPNYWFTSDWHQEPLSLTASAIFSYLGYPSDGSSCPHCESAILWFTLIHTCLHYAIQKKLNN